VAIDERLVGQLNIEKRPAVGDSLLATTDILNVRPEVCGSRESHITEGRSCKAVAYNTTSSCWDHLQTGLQETAGAGVMPEVIDGNDERREIDLSLNDIMFVVEQDLKNSGIRSVEGTGHEESEGFMLQPTCEDAVDGPRLFPEYAYGAVPDTLSYQLPTVANGLPCTVSGSGEYSALYSSVSVAARPVAVTDVWRSLPVENGVAEPDFTKAQLAEQNSERKMQYMSLPMAVPVSCAQSSANQLSASVSQRFDVAQEDIVHTGAASCSDFWRPGLLDMAGVTDRKQATNGGAEKRETIVQSSAQPDRSPPPDFRRQCTSVYLQTPDIGLAVVKPQLPSSVANDRLMPSAVPSMDRILSVRSPVGHITGTMSDLSLDNSHHPLLRGILMESPAPQVTGRDQVTSLFAFICSASVTMMVVGLNS